MLQADVFMAYGLASSAALVARKQLADSEHPVVNRYFVAATLWVACLFAPAVLWLLWSFPAWQTMLVIEDHAALPGWLAGGAMLLLVTSGVVGFAATAMFVHGGRPRAAALQAVWSLGVTGELLLVGWDGTALTRMLYVGTKADWDAGVSYAFADFFGSPMFAAVLVIGAVVGLPYAYLLWRWRGEARALATSPRP